MERKLLTAFLLFLSLIPAFAQPGSRADEVRTSNGNLLRLLAVLESTPAPARASIQAQGAPIIAARASALAALVAQDPAQALLLAFPPEALARLAAAFPASAAQLESHGSWSGPVDYTILDNLNLTTAESRIRLSSAAGVLQVHIAGVEPRGLKCGDRLQVAGVRVKDLVAAQDGSVQVTSVAAAAATCAPTGNQSTVAILATFPGVTPPAITAASVYTMLFGPGARSVDGYWREASYGAAWATGKVVGWYTLDKLYTCDQYYDMLSAAIRAADADVNFLDYSRVFVIFPNPGSCAWAGLSNVGCSSYSSPGEGSFRASASWMLSNYFTNTDQAVKLATHEGGHALGLMHSRSRDFGAEALGAIGAAGTLSEYGDLFSSMGSWNLGHYTMEQKLRLGWLPAANVTTVQNSGSFSILPAENPATGTQALKVLRGTGNTPWLWLEYRQPLGSYDSALNSQVFSGALIHYYDSSTGSYTNLLDYTTGTSAFNDPALAAGSSWTDPYSNLSLSINSASPSGLAVSVNYGPLPCVSASPTVSLSPANPSLTPGGSVNYTVTVANKDSVGCSPRAFSLSSSAPLNWPTTFSTTALTISPGQSASATMTKTAPAGTSPATYTVDATVTSASPQVTATASASVLAPPPPISAALASSAATYAAKSTAAITATVTGNGTPVSGATVVFTMTKPNGATATQTAATASTGKAVWNYRFNPKDPKGTYSVTAKATLGAQSATSAAVYFVLQ